MFIDVHAHCRLKSSPLGGRNVFLEPEQLLRVCDEYAIDKAVILPIVSPEHYLPQSVEEVALIVSRHPDRLAFFCNLDPRACGNSGSAPLEEILEYYIGLGCIGIGEVLPALDILDPKVQNLFHHAEKAGLPLTFDLSPVHDGAYGLYDAAGLPGLEESLKRFPELTFIGHSSPFWAELGPLDNHSGRFGNPPYPVRKEGRVFELMRRCPNLHADLSAPSGENAMLRDRANAVRFLNEFQDRVMFGTDICVSGQKLKTAEFLVSLRDAGEITNAVFAKIAAGNAEKLFARL